MKVTELPEIPDEIKEASKRKELAVFIGAGVSRLLGCWGWEDLANKLIKKCHEKGIISFIEKDSLLKEPDHLIKITISKSLLSGSEYKEEFFRMIKEALKYKDERSSDPIKENIYDHIFRLRALNITTNADTLFNKKFSNENIIYDIDYLNPNIFKTDLKDKLIKIHGCISDINSLIFSLPEYIGRYNTQSFQRFLKTLFSKYTILFLGYGLKELDLLRIVFNNNSEKKHFLLKPFYQAEANLVKFYQSYYSELGITVIDYDKDKRGYLQLIEILKQWSKKFNEINQNSIEDYREIDSILDE